MSDFSGVAASVFGASAALVAKATDPRRRVRFPWRDADEIEIERVKLAAMLQGRQIDDAQVVAILGDVDRVLIDAALAMIRRPVEQVGPDG